MSENWWFMDTTTTFRANSPTFSRKFAFSLAQESEQRVNRPHYFECGTNLQASQNLRFAPASLLSAHDIEACRRGDPANR